MLVLALVAAALGVGVYFAALRLPSSRPVVRMLVFLGAVLAAWVPVEVVVAGLLRSRGQLVRLDAPDRERGKGPA
jgi:hypothetical protein